jgi:phage terminase large subunit
MSLQSIAPQPYNVKAKPSPDDAWELIQYYADGRQVEFVRDVLGRNPWSMQATIIQDVFKYPVVAVKSCNAAGKSDLASDVALTFLVTIPGSIVITTAPTWRQVKDVLWRYIRDKYAKAPIKLSSKQCKQVGLDLAEDWYAVGLSTKDSEKFFGYHADNILVIIDEASGVEEEIYVGVDAVTPNINAHVLAIGNPTNPEGRFYKMFQDPLVKKHTISVFDTPNFTANGITSLEMLLDLFTPPAGVEPIEHMMAMQRKLNMPIPALISPATVYRRYIQWGPEHPMWEALIMGEFPSQATTSLIPLGLIIKSRDVWLQLEAAKKNKALGREIEKRPEWNIETSDHMEYGVDIARFGDDSNVIFPRNGGYVQPATSWSKVDTSITTSRVIDNIDTGDHKALIKVDDTGVGGGVTDQLNKALRDDPDSYYYTVVPVNFASGTTNPRKWFNLRSEMHDKLAQLFKDHKIAIPDDEDLIAELAAIRVQYVGKENNILQVESKQKLKDRLKKSPDRADALVLAFAQSPLISRRIEETVQQAREREYRQSVLRPVTGGLDDRY